MKQSGGMDGLEGWEGLGRREGASYAKESVVQREVRTICAACSEEEIAEIVRLLGEHLKNKGGVPSLPMMGEE